MGAHTTIVSFQNGVLKDQALRAHYGDAAVMGGVGYVATTIDAPGVIRQTGPMQRLLFGEFDGSRSPRGVRRGVPPRLGRAAGGGLPAARGFSGRPGGRP